MAMTVHSMLPGPAGQPSDLMQEPGAPPQPQAQGQHSCPVCGLVHEGPKQEKAPSFLENLWGAAAGRGYK